MGRGSAIVHRDPKGTASPSSKSESACQAHDVLGVDLGFERSQLWQIFPVNIDERRVGIRVVPVQRRRVVGERSLRFGNGRKAFC